MYHPLDRFRPIPTPIFCICAIFCLLFCVTNSLRPQLPLYFNGEAWDRKCRDLLDADGFIPRALTWAKTISTWVFLSALGACLHVGVAITCYDIRTMAAGTSGNDFILYTFLISLTASAVFGP